MDGILFQIPENLFLVIAFSETFIANVQMCTSCFSLFFLWSQKSSLMLYQFHLQHTALCNANRRDDTHPEVSHNVFTFEICPLAIDNPLTHPRKFCLSITSRTDSQNLHMKFIAFQYLTLFHFPCYLQCLPRKHHDLRIFCHVYSLLSVLFSS